MRQYVSHPDCRAAGSSMSAFTSDPTGNNLPSEHAPWLRDGRRSALSIDEVGPVVARAVKERGFFVISSHATSRRWRFG